MDAFGRYYVEWRKSDSKGWYCMSPLLWNSSTGETKLWWQKSDQWLPGGRRKLSGVLEMFFILTGVMVLQGRTFVKTHQTVHLKWVHSISCNLYLFYWKGSEKKENIVTDQSGWEGLGEGKPIRVGTLVWGDWISVTTVHSPAGSALPRGPSSWPAPSQNPSHRMAPRNVCCGMKRGGPFPFTFFV